MMLITLIHNNAAVSWTFQLGIALLFLLALWWFRREHLPSAPTPLDKVLNVLIPTFSMGLLLFLLLAIIFP